MGKGGGGGSSGPKYKLPPVQKVQPLGFLQGLPNSPDPTDPIQRIETITTTSGGSGRRRLPRTHGSGHWSKMSSHRKKKYYRDPKPGKTTTKKVVKNVYGSGRPGPMLPEFVPAPELPEYGLVDVRDFVDERDKALEEWGMRRLQPQFEEQRDALQTQLVSRGLMPGSEAFERAIHELSTAEGDAVAGLMLQGRAAERELAFDQARREQERLRGLFDAQRQRDMVEWGMGYTHRMTPYHAQLDRDLAMLDSETARHVANLSARGGAAAAYERGRQQRQGSMMSGLFGLGSTLITGAFGLSDPRFKKHARPVGKGHKGLTIYEYQLGNRTERGYLADEVMEVEPEAVLHGPGGYMMLDYAKLGGKPHGNV